MKIHPVWSFFWLRKALSSGERPEMSPPAGPGPEYEDRAAAREARLPTGLAEEIALERHGRGARGRGIALGFGDDDSR